MEHCALYQQMGMVYLECHLHLPLGCLGHPLRRQSAQHALALFLNRNLKPDAWLQMVPASPVGAGYWSPVYPHPQTGMEYWARPFYPPNMSPQVENASTRLQMLHF